MMLAVAYVGTGNQACHVSSSSFYLLCLVHSLRTRNARHAVEAAYPHIWLWLLQSVSGLHNWIYFAKEESQNRVNYLGYLKYSELGNVSTNLNNLFTVSKTSFILLINKHYYNNAMKA